MSKMEFIIGKEYLEDLYKKENWRKKLMDELSSLTDKYIVYLIPYGKSGDYSDVRALVSCVSIDKGYSILPIIKSNDNEFIPNDYDLKKIKALLGNQVEGSIKTGYKFRKTA